MTDDAELLSQYAQKGSDTAFAALVDRYLPLVYAAALRLVRGDEALAKDVAQTVFIDLARKARSLLGRELLAGWLYTSTRLAASKAVRGARRRQLREQIAVSMQERTTQPESPQDEGELKLVLDEAMSELGSDERNAVLIRFFQGKDLKDVGVALGISEDAARMRVTRALAKLQVLLKARGVTIPTVALGTALATEAVAAVPAGLAATISAAAVASAAAGGGITATLLEFMTKTKIQLGIISVIAVAVVAIPLAIQPQSRAKLREENQVLRQQVSQLAQAAAENERLSNLLAQAKSPASLSREQASELLKLRGEVGVLRRQNAELHAAQHVGKLEDQTAGADS
jgi:RNA polymerase sigma factor (sigma-70 family)